MGAIGAASTGAYLAGLGTGLSLIVAIGAQNAFVLKQGLLRQHVFWVCLFCAVSDAVLIAAGAAPPSLAATLATIAALTWLNPHVWLDTVVLLGAVSSTWPDRLSFALGAMSGSFLFFFALGYGARLLAPVFARPLAWRVLDGLVALVMWSIAAALIFRG